MKRIIYPDTEFETNGDCSSFQINFDPDSWLELEVDKLRQDLKRMGFPVFDPPIDEPYSIIFSTLAIEPVFWDMVG